MDIKKIKTLGDLKASDYKSLSVKDELRKNLISALKNKEKVFEGILGFEDTVIPDLERAILSRHNTLFLGLRGQAKTRIARLMVKLLDEYVPVIKGSELNDDPLEPLSRFALDMIKEHGDKTPVAWLHREDRYVEKLATPDVSVADLIGDVDPIKAATLKLPYSDERVIHFGLIPRAHRSIFVINELPDLQARIQVSLFNILQEGDIQIRGFKLRLPLDVSFVFTANPEDYTNRGSIITPLKDRIESQILTHYPNTIEIARKITSQEAKITAAQNKSIIVPELLKELLERVSFVARESEFIDEKSGVSARLSISAYEQMVSAAERRLLINNEKKARVKISDLCQIVPAITGKVELVYEGEQEGAFSVAQSLIDNAIKEEFLLHFPNPEKLKKKTERDPYEVIRTWFGAGNEVGLASDLSDKDYKKELDKVQGLKRLVSSVADVSKEDLYVYMELCLHGLSSFNILTKEIIDSNTSFSDPLANMWQDDDFGSGFTEN
ncbi:MAG: magnesium chelatase [Saprospiraceae bacterium]